jgi:hypothetical protein
MNIIVLFIQNIYLNIIYKYISRCPLGRIKLHEFNIEAAQETLIFFFIGPK